MSHYKYTRNGREILKDGHTMFPSDVVKDLNRKSFLEGEIIKLRANAMPGGHGCCDICDTGGCCKAESEEG